MKLKEGLYFGSLTTGSSENYTLVRLYFDLNSVSGDHSWNMESSDTYKDQKGVDRH